MQCDLEAKLVSREPAHMTVTRAEDNGTYHLTGCWHPHHHLGGGGGGARGCVVVGGGGQDDYHTLPLLAACIYIKAAGQATGFYCLLSPSCQLSAQTADGYYTVSNVGLIVSCKFWVDCLVCGILQVKPCLLCCCFETKLYDCVVLRAIFNFFNFILRRWTSSPEQALEMKLESGNFEMCCYF